MVKWRSLLVGGVISALCVWLLVRTVDVPQAGRALLQADPRWLLLAWGLTIASLAVRCWRWQLLFLPHNRVRYGSTVASTMIGYMFNTVLPGRVGELARGALISQTDHVATVRALGTILVEKILDVLVLLVLLGGLTAVLPLPAEAATAGKTAAIVFGALAVGFFVLANLRTPVVALVRRFLDPLPLIGRFTPSRLTDLVLGAADSLRVPRLLALHVVLAPLMWVFSILSTAACARAFALQVPWSASGLVVALTALGMTVPSAPGYVGVYHGIVVFALSPFGVDASRALAFAFTLHAIGFGTFLIGGAIFLVVGLARQQYRLEDLWRWRTSATASAGTAAAPTEPRVSGAVPVPRPAAQEA